MRPTILNPLFAAVSSLPGIGPKTVKLYDKLLADGGEARLVDALFHLPHSGIDRSKRTTIAEAPVGEIVTFEAVVVEHRSPGRNSKAPLRVIVEDDTAEVALIYFGANTQWVERALPLGEKRWISGKLETYDGKLQMVHPDKVLDEAALAKLPPIEPVYGLTEGLYQRNVQKAVEAALARVPDMPEWHDDATLALRKLPTFKAALTALHLPDSAKVFEPTSLPRVRLALDELLASQIALAMMRAQFREQRGRPTVGDGRLSSAIEGALPFSLTGSQTEALAEVRADMASDKRMLRLLQGDVGSGKTLVALLAMATAVEAGRQAAMMAPTEILARQHYERMLPMCEAVRMRVALITGRDKASERTKLLKALAAGDIDLLIGTHAMFQESVQFRDLALAVVDEQHRFGVHQRLALGEKGESVDVLVMTATPIPRTLVLTYFGDMDVSTLREKPAGRQPVDTRAMPIERIDEVVEGLHRALANGAQVYWVCPLVEENEDLDVAAAQDRFEDLQKIFGPEHVGLVHGKMKGRDKDAAMEAFQRKETQVLVATTVIEVGVDVPNATIMVIEHAERFGLAQLHQLRGRVGRGSGKSTCLLLYKGPLGEVSKARIAIMRETEDGFRIAEEDLRLRGEGEILGTRQSGTPGFRLADLAAHAGLLPLARDTAQRVIRDDPNLESEQGQTLRLLLYVFERDEAVRLLRAG